MNQLEWQNYPWKQGSASVTQIGSVFFASMNNDWVKKHFCHKKIMQHFDLPNRAQGYLMEITYRFLMAVNLRNSSECIAIKKKKKSIWAARISVSTARAATSAVQAASVLSLHMNYLSEHLDRDTGLFLLYFSCVCEVESMFVNDWRKSWRDMRRECP